MKTIYLKTVMSDADAHGYIKDPAFVEHAPMIIDEEFIAKDENGVVQFAYIKMDEDEYFIKLKRILQNLNYGKSTRTSGLYTESSVFGFQPPVYIRMRPYCSLTGIRQKLPKVDAFLAFYCEKKIMPLFKEFCEHNLKEHMEAIKDIKPQWLMKNIPFTGGVINNSNQLNYHTDIQNIKGSINAMIYFVRDTAGGELVCPKFGVSIKPLDRYVLLFRNDLVHGVAPIKKMNKDAYRFSIVYYANEHMDKCGTMAEELAKARSKKSEFLSNDVTKEEDAKN